MSKFVQTSTVVSPARPAVLKQSVEFYVNVYRQPDGKIRPGAKTYRKAANAERNADATGGNVFVGVEKLVISR